MVLNLQISNFATRFAAVALMLVMIVAPGGAKDRARVVSPGDLETRLVEDVKGPFTLTVEIDGLRNSTGNIDLLVFDQAQGWPDEIPYSIRKFEVPAVEGNMVMKVPNLPQGDYAVIVVHDENLNRRIDKDWRGVPIEQWGMSNNPRVYMSTPAYHRAKFHMQGDMEVHVPMKLYP
jgi:uncharacterized protein (DUF2141 family)